MQIACMTTTKAKQISTKTTTTTTTTKAEPSLIDWKGAHASESSDPRDVAGRGGGCKEGSTINLDSQYPNDRGKQNKSTKRDQVVQMKSFQVQKRVN